LTPEVVQLPQRRKFSAEYRLRILREADACSKRGELGALLRREGLYSSHLVDWRRQRDEGLLQSLTPRQRGRKPAHPAEVENQQLRKENARLNEELGKARLVIDVQGKVSALLGLVGAKSAEQHDQ
jgi:transposase-like protein